MKKILRIAFMSGLLLAALGVCAETNQTVVADAQHPAVCPHCGFVQTNQTTASVPVIVKSATTNDWKASVYGGFSAQSGNTTASSYNYGGEFSRQGEVYRGKLKLDGKYSKSADAVTVSKTEASGEMRRMLDERWFAYGLLSALHDGLKDLDYRVKAGPGLGYYFVDTKDLTSDVSSGPLYVSEQKSGTRSGYLAWRFAQGLSWQITDTFRWWTSTELDMNGTGVASYLVAFSTGVDTKISDNLSLLIVFEDDYDSQPESKGNIEKNDASIKTGIRYKF
jgi:putative salt-induced outer membrane protein YdiY